MPTRTVLSSDDAITREGLRLLVGQASQIEIVGEADTIKATPEKVRELAPDVVLIEIGVPSRTQGLQAAATVADQSPETHTLVLTNNSDLPYVRSMLAGGVSGYLLKSSDSSQLFTALRTLKLGGKFIDPTLRNDLIWPTSGRKAKKARPAFSRREMEVFRALVQGYTNTQAADLLKVSVKSVETYRLRIYRKLQLHNRAEIVQYALAHRLLTHV